MSETKRPELLSRNEASFCFQGEGRANIEEQEICLTEAKEEDQSLPVSNREKQTYPNTPCMEKKAYIDPKSTSPNVGVIC